MTTKPSYCLLMLLEIIKNSMKKPYIAIVLVIVLLIAAALTIKPKDTSHVVIGAIIPQTEFGAYWGGPVLKGIQLAEKELSKTYNSPFKVIVEDSQGNPSLGVTAAQKLLNVDKVDGLYTEFSGVSSAVSPVAASARKALVYSTFNQKVVEDNPLSFKTFLSYESACSKLIPYLKDKNQKVLIISAISDAARYCQKALAVAIGEQNIKIIEGYTSKDFRTILVQNKEFNPDFIVPIMYEDGYFALMKQNYELGTKAKLFCYKQDCLTEKLVRELPAGAVEGTLYFEVDIDKDFMAKIKAEFPDITNDDLQGASNAYQSVMILGEALYKCERQAECAVKYVSDKKDLRAVGYHNSFMSNRVLQTELIIGSVKNKILTRF